MAPAFFDEKHIASHQQEVMGSQQQPPSVNAKNHFGMEQADAVFVCVVDKALEGGAESLMAMADPAIPVRVQPVKSRLQWSRQMHGFQRRCAIDCHEPPL